MVFGAIEAGPLAIARLQSSAIAQEQLSLLMANPQLRERGLLRATIVGGPDLTYTFANWNSPSSPPTGCEKSYDKIFQFSDALNAFRVSVVRDECFVVAEQKLILKYSSLATILVALVALILFAIAIWPVAVSIRNAEQAFAMRFKNIGAINFRPIKLLVREGIRNVDLEREQALTSLAQQVSHDIRSPLSALQMALKLTPGIPKEKASIILNATNRINAIADHLIEGRREIVNQKANGLLYDELNKLIAEKQLELSNRLGIFLKLDFKCEPDLSSPMESSELARILSNLINNSVEAIDGGGTIIVGARSSKSGIEIIVSDSGRGIPAEFISKLGEQNFTFGKVNGNGIGLVNARRLVESAGGRFSIQSKEAVGTIIKMSFENLYG